MEAIPQLISAGLNMVGGSFSDFDNQVQRERQMLLQKEFAQKGLQWRVADAEKAGIHPLAALGFNASGYQPVASEGPNSGELMMDLGQNLAGAMSRSSTQQDKEMAALQIMSMKQDVTGKELDNQIRAKTLQDLNTDKPSFPGGENFMPGQGNSGKVKVVPSQRTASATGRPAQEAGWTPDVGYARTDTGLTPIPSKDVKERIEDQFVPELMWAIRNQLTPNIGVGRPPPKEMLPQGYSKWKWSYTRQEWQPSNAKNEDRENKFRETARGMGY